MINILRLVSLALFICLPAFSVAQDSSNVSTSPPLAKLTLPVAFDRISVLDNTRDTVTKWFGEGYFVDEGGHTGSTFHIDQERQVVMKIEYGTDWHVDEIAFSYGLDTPKGIHSLKQFPKAAISKRLTPTLSLDNGIRLGATVKEVLAKCGKPAKDTTDETYRVLRYETDYEHTEQVLFYEATFLFKNNRLVRFRIYNGD